MSFRGKLLTSAVGGLLLFLVTYSGVLHGITSPPAGYVPAFGERTLDMGMYLSWLADLQTGWLLPNRDVPYMTEPALFQPMVVLIAATAKLLHTSAVASYYLWQIGLFIGAVSALLCCAETYLDTKRQWVAAACVVVCSLPFFLYRFAIPWVPVPGKYGLLGVAAYAYQTSDGLFRAGLSNGPNLTFGTMTMLLAFAYLGRYIKTERRADFVGLCICTFANALFHPFEFYVFVTVALICLAVLRGREQRLGSTLPLGATLLVCVAIGMLPHLVQTARSQWLKDASDSNPGMSSPAFVIAAYGLPTLVLAFLFLVRRRVQEKLDMVLLCWILVSYALQAVPAIPCGVHLLDGFVYGQAILLVRMALQDPQLPRLFAKVRRPALAAGYGLVACSVWTLGAMWVQIYQDGNSTTPALLNAIQPQDEAHALAWLKTNASAGSLVLAPEPMARWVPTVSMQTIGSHDVLSIRYAEQVKVLQQFYGGDVSAGQIRTFVEQYGVRYIVVPASSKFAGLIPGRRIERFGALDLFACAGSPMKPYPEEGMLPERGQSAVRHAVLQVVAFLLRQT